MKYFIGVLFVMLLCGGTGHLAAQFCARVPYQSVGGKMMVKARVNDVEGNFLFDTGAPVCISYSFAQKLGIKSVNTAEFQDSNGQKSTGGVARLSCVVLGGVNFAQVDCALFEQGDMIESFGVDGIIGYTLFADKIIELNGRDKVIMISDSPDYFSLNPAWACDLIRNNYVPYMTVKLGKETIDTVMFDSGAAGFYDISMKSYERLQKTEVLRTISRGRGILSLGAGGLENETLKYRVEVPQFFVGCGQFARVTSVTTKGESRLGAALLRYGIVTIDYPRHKLYFQPFQDSVPDLYAKEWNVVITVMNNQLTAGFVWESMWNEVKGGEKIVEVNGKHFDQVDAWKAMTTNLVGLSGEQAEIVVIDPENGKEKRLNIRKE